MRPVQAAGLAAMTAAAMILALPTTAVAEDELIHSDLNLPETIPGASGFDDEATQIKWQPKIVNGDEADNADHPGTYTITAQYADGSEPDLSLHSSDERCEGTKAKLVCEEPNANGKPYEWEFDLFLQADADATYRDEPVQFTGVFKLNDKVWDTDTGEVTIVPDERADRVRFELPEEISADVDADSDGLDVPVTVTNNTDTALTDAQLKLWTQWDGKPSLKLSQKDERCKLNGDGEGSVCTIDSLAPGESTEFDLTIRVSDTWKTSPDTGLGGDVRVDNADWAAHYEPITVVAGDGSGPAADKLPVTGMSLTLPLAGGAAALLLSGVALLVTRRRAKATS
jgi:hypothetical protein